MLTRRRLLIAGTVAVVLLVGGFLGLGAAEQRALAAEEAYVTAQFQNESCFEDWGVDEGAATKSAAVTGPTVGGVRVNVTMPYAVRYETEEGPLFADAASEAVYEVTPITTRRISGDTIAPCG